jgi:hypothetical protein
VYIILRGENMISNINSYLESAYQACRVGAFPERKFQPGILDAELTRLAEKSRGLIRIHTAGNSFEGRPIRHVAIGTGPVSVLLWSQMHGDESTATMAICDILNFLPDPGYSEFSGKFLSALTLHFIPMLNPDGAARFQRRTAHGIDMNRDARLLRTPEARILASIRADLKPALGFNLHDQELSTVGSSRDITAIALLAPAFDASRSDNDVRLRAKHLAEVFAGTVGKIVPGRMAKYDDSFEPRAFGDMMQSWGVSTLLVESGHVPGDPEKNLPRKLNFIGILASLQAMVDGNLNSAGTRLYDSLPFNGKRAYDVIVRNVQVDFGGGNVVGMDLGISAQVDTHSEPPAKLVDCGDLSTFVGMVEVDAAGKLLPPALCQLGAPFAWEKL